MITKKLKISQYVVVNVFLSPQPMNEDKDVNIFSDNSV